MKHLSVEIADTPLKREMGLMNRHSLMDDEGMLFRFTNKQQLGFWMSNTYIPLEIAFINDDGKIDQIEEMFPLSTRMVRSKKACRYALEVNKGWFKSNGIKVGDLVGNLDITNRRKFAQTMGQWTSMTPSPQTPQTSQPLPPSASAPLTTPNQNVQIAPKQNQQNKTNQVPNQVPNQVDPNVMLNMSIRDKIKYANDNNKPMMIVYTTLKGNTLPPRKMIMPDPNSGYVIGSGKNGAHLLAYDASPSINGPMIIEGGHLKTFLLSGIISLEIMDLEKNKNQKEKQLAKKK